jgi:hypothetical protein
MRSGPEVIIKKKKKKKMSAKRSLSSQVQVLNLILIA